MKTALIRFTVGICLLFSIQVRSMASSILVSGIYDGTYTWNVDTVYIVGDCTYDSLFIDAGTFVQFLGDFLFKSKWMEAKGTDFDSITFAGNLSPNGEPYGTISSGGCIKCIPGTSRISLVKVIGLNYVSLYITRYSRFINCDSIHASYSEYNMFENNNYIYFSLFLTENEVIRNQELSFAPGYYMEHDKSIFECKGNYFEGNQTGLILDTLRSFNRNMKITIENNHFTDNTGPLLWIHGCDQSSATVKVFENLFQHNNGDVIDVYSKPLHSSAGLYADRNRFIENNGLSIKIECSSYGITNNLFLRNNNSNGPGTILINNFHVIWNSYTIRNNTFIGNEGNSAGCIEVIGKRPVNLSLTNNIFWSNTGIESEYRIKLKLVYSFYPPNNILISNNATEDTSRIVSYSDTLSTLLLTLDSNFVDYPEFVDTLNDNYRLKIYSPYIDMGTGSPDGSDLDGNPRVSGSAVDIGAYEYIPNCYPEILYQSGDTNLFIGDTLRLKVQTSDTCDYSWFLNNSLLAGEKDICVVIDSVVSADTGEYKVRISNLTDTIWSAPMHVMVYPYTRTSVLPDSLYLCPDSIKLSIDIEGINFLWSTGDTNSSITVNETGSYWVRLTDSSGLYLNDTVVVYHPSSIEISGSYGYGYEFCADTLLVVGNCEFGRVNLKPGTFILFTGDYTIKLDWFESNGTETDSITFCGSLLLNDTIKQGNIIEPNIGYWKEPPSSLSLTRLVNLKSVAATRAEKCSFLQCHSVQLVYSNSNKLLRNDIVHFNYSVDNCQVVENKLLSFSFYYDMWYSQQYYFNCTNSTFLRNSSGLTTGGSGILHIENCRFIENADPVVNYHVTSNDKYHPASVSIRYNKFYKNIGNILVFDFMGAEFTYVGITNNEFIENEGIAVSCDDSRYLTVNSNLFLKNSTSSGPGSIYYYNDRNENPVSIMNNTFVANRGETFGCMEIISDTTCPINLIANNIFWENSAKQSEYAVGINFLNPPSEVCELNLTHSVARDTSKIALISGVGFELAPKNSFNLYPEFVDSLNDNYRLKSYSPYIHMGTGSPGGTDLDGNPRVFGNAVDIGAYEFIPVSNPELFSQSTDTLLCTGDSVLLSAETNDFCIYQWYVDGELIENANTNLFSAKCPDDDSDIFQLRISGLNDTLWTDKITISKAEPPAIALSSDSVKVCMNEDVSISLDYVSLLPISVQWFSQNSGKIPVTGDTVLLTEINEDDKLFAIVKNTCGTDTSGIINLLVLKLPEPYLGGDTAIRANERIILNAGPGYPHYLWNDNSIGQYRVAYAGDTVWCRVTDEAGCSGSDTITIALNPLNLRSIDGEKLQVKIYPIPAVNVLTIELPWEILFPCTLSIFNMSGGLIKQQELHSAITRISVDEFGKTGMYILEIRNESFNESWKLMIEL